MFESTMAHEALLGPEASIERPIRYMPGSPVRGPIKGTVKRFLRLLPTALLMLIVLSLLFVTLMPLAFIHAHRRLLYATNTIAITSSPASHQPNVRATSVNINSLNQNNNTKTIPEGAMDPIISSNSSDPVSILNQSQISTDRYQMLLNAARIKQINATVQEQQRSSTSGRPTPPTIVNEISSKATATTTSMKSSPSDARKLSQLQSNNSNQSCPSVPPRLVGRLKVLTNLVSFDQLEHELTDLLPGGRYRPTECISRHKVAIIIPYRDREEHLRIFLHNLHPMLMRQQIDYGIYVVEEIPNTKFNRAKLMNVGFKEALKQYDYQCFIFHDVDLIPEDDRNLYTCPDQPRHMSVAIDTMHYRLPYKDIFGGVSAVTKEQMEKVNGFSNEYWGWGAEDDDFSNRIRHHGFRISRYPAEIARYKMLKHRKETPNPDRYKKLYKGRMRFRTDGLSNLNYKLEKVEFGKLYTHLLVNLLQPLFVH